MDLKRANEELEQLSNEENYWLNEKELAKLSVMPKSVDPTIERVSGGKRTDKMTDYLITLDEKGINENLERIRLKRENLLSYIEQELKILNKYGDVEKQIIYYREHAPKQLTWDEISKKVSYCERQCIRIYERAKQKKS